MPLDEVAGGCLGVLFRFLLEVVFEILLYGFFYGTGWILLKIFTVGKISIQPTADSRFIKRGRVGTKRGKSGRASSGTKRTVSADATALLGIVFWIAVAFCFWMFWM